MPFWRLYYHLIWPTKHREPLITPALEERLYPYLIRRAADDGVYVYAINSWVDHVHLVVAIPPKHAVADIVKRLKGASSRYLTHEHDIAFEWHRGYGALSVGERQRPIAEAYVRNQKQHHTQQSTNSWLERADEFDEGPPDRQEKPLVQKPALREATVSYDLNNDLPF